MRAVAGTFVADQRGGMLPVFAVLLSAVLTMAALVVDASRLYLVQNQLQSTADAAALGAVTNLHDPSSARAASERIAAANMPTDSWGTVLAASSIELGTWNEERREFTTNAPNPDSVRVTARRSTATGNPESTLFARLIGQDKINLAATAIARYKPLLPLCILALHPTASSALDVTGSADLIANDCTVYVNSSSPQAITLAGNAQVRSLSTCVVGGTTGGNFTPAPQTGCPPLADPLASLPAPAVSPCNHNNRVLASGTIAIGPGVYCGGLTVESGTNVTMQPGTYVFTGGPLNVKGHASVTGTGVFIYLDGGAGVLTIAGGADINLSAPTSGAYAGVVVYASRSTTGLTHAFTGNSTLHLNGAIYFPTGKIVYSGNSSGAVTMLIANTIQLSGSSGFQRRSNLTNVPIPAGFGKTFGAKDSPTLVQ